MGSAARSSRGCTPTGRAWSPAAAATDRRTYSTDDDWDLQVGVNCRGVFNASRAVLPEMSEHGGVIVYIGSISGVVADLSSALYNASKAFVHALTRSIAVDHGPQVRCNAVLPGWIETDMADEGFDLVPDPDAARPDAARRHPLGRFGRLGDIAGVVAWLASDEASWATGQCFMVDGGLTAASPLRPELIWRWRPDADLVLARPVPATPGPEVSMWNTLCPQRTGNS